MENTQYSNNKQVLICPIVGAWIFFLMHLIIFINYIFGYAFISLFIILYLFIVVLLLTLSIERDKYNLFLVSFIMTIIYDVIITLGFIILLIRIKGKEWFVYFIWVLFEWVLFVILLAYKKKIFKSTRQNESINENINLIQI